MRNLKPEELIPYLPYSLKVIMEGKICNVAWMSTKNIAIIKPNGIGEIKKISWKHAHLNITPILKPLKDLVKDKETFNFLFESCKSIDENIDYISEFSGDLLNTSLSYRAVSILIAGKYDVKGLIKKGLAIDINTLDK